MAGRVRIVAGEGCPRCGARPGENCRNYKGRGMAPHVIYETAEQFAARERGEEARGEPAERKPYRKGKRVERYWTQGYLFGSDFGGAL